MKRRHLALALTPLLLVACGFHLKGTARGDNRLRELQLDWPNGVDGELDSALKAALQQQNITLRAGAVVRLPAPEGGIVGKEHDSAVHSHGVSSMWLR